MALSIGFAITGEGSVMVVAEAILLLPFDSKRVVGGFLDKPKVHASMHVSVAHM